LFFERQIFVWDEQLGDGREVEMPTETELFEVFCEREEGGDVLR